MNVRNHNLLRTCAGALIIFINTACLIAAPAQQRGVSGSHASMGRGQSGRSSIGSSQTISGISGVRSRPTTLGTARTNPTRITETRVGTSSRTRISPTTTRIRGARISSPTTKISGLQRPLQKQQTLRGTSWNRYGRNWYRHSNAPFFRSGLFLSLGLPYYNWWWERNYYPNYWNRTIIVRDYSNRDSIREALAEYKELVDQLKNDIEDLRNENEILRNKLEEVMPEAKVVATA
jgi:hypothetical protein